MASKPQRISWVVASWRICQLAHIKRYANSKQTLRFAPRYTVFAQMRKKHFYILLRKEQFWYRPTFAPVNLCRRMSRVTLQTRFYARSYAISMLPTEIWYCILPAQHCTASKRLVYLPAHRQNGWKRSIRKNFSLCIQSIYLVLWMFFNGFLSSELNGSGRAFLIQTTRKTRQSCV